MGNLNIVVHVDLEVLNPCPMITFNSIGPKEILKEG